MCCWLVQAARGRRARSKERVARVFELAGIAVRVQHTTHEGHAAEVAAALDLASVDGVVCVSGDGLVNEVRRTQSRNTAYKERGVV